VICDVISVRKYREQMNFCEFCVLLIGVCVCLCVGFVCACARVCVCFTHEVLVKKVLLSRGCCLRGSNLCHQTVAAGVESRWSKMDESESTPNIHMDSRWHSPPQHNEQGSQNSSPLHGSQTTNPRTRQSHCQIFEERRQQQISSWRSLERQTSQYQSQAPPPPKY